MRTALPRPSHSDGSYSSGSELAGEEAGQEYFIKDLDTGQLMRVDAYEMRATSESDGAVSSSSEYLQNVDPDGGTDSKKKWSFKKGSLSKTGLSKWAKSTLNATKTKLHAIQEKVEKASSSVHFPRKGYPDDMFETSSEEEPLSDGEKDGEREGEETRASLSSQQRTSAGSPKTARARSSPYTLNINQLYDKQRSNSMDGSQQQPGLGHSASELAVDYYAVEGRSPSGPQSGPSKGEMGGSMGRDFGRPRTSPSVHQPVQQESMDSIGMDGLQEEEDLKQASITSSTPETIQGSYPSMSMQGYTHLPAKVWCRNPTKHLGTVCLIQNFQVHDGVVWVMKLSNDGRLIATGGQDGAVRVWTVIQSGGCSRPATGLYTTAAPTASNSEYRQCEAVRGAYGDRTEVASESSVNSTASACGMNTRSTSAAWMGSRSASTNGGLPASRAVVNEKPAMVFHGHKEDVLDLSWSRGTLLLSASVDGTVRLWRADQHDQLEEYPHPDMVTSVCFHPSDAKRFVSGCVDGRVRVWSLVDATVIASAAIHQDIVTSVAFVHEGQQLAAGTMRGKCRFYKCNATNKLEYMAQIDVKDSSSSAGASGSRITSIQDVPHQIGELLIATNDSRLRRYRGYAQQCKYKGLRNASTCVRASMSSCGGYIFSGSDDGRVYMWETTPPEGKKAKANVDPQPSLDPLTGGGGVEGSAKKPGKAKNAAFECFQTSESTTTSVIVAPLVCWSSGFGGVEGYMGGAVFFVTGFSGHLSVFENFVT